MLKRRIYVLRIDVLSLVAASLLSGDGHIKKLNGQIHELLVLIVCAQMT